MEIKVKKQVKMITIFRDKIEEILFQKYGKDFVEITQSTGYQIDVVIHYPHFVIKNEQNRVHDIHDLYVKIPFRVENNNQIRWGGVLLGLRTTFTSEELLAGYSHSHLHREQHGWDEFCLGEGPLLDALAKSIENPISYTFPEDDMNFELYVQGLFYNIDQYVVSESIEGVPYIAMETIPSLGSVDTIGIEMSPFGYVSNINDTLIKVMKQIIKDFPELVKFNPSTDSYYLNRNVDLSGLIPKLIDPSYLVYQIDDKYYYITSNNNTLAGSNINIQKQVTDRFNDKIIRFEKVNFNNEELKVTLLNDKIKKETKKVISPLVLNTMEKYINFKYEQYKSARTHSD